MLGADVVMVQCPGFFNGVFNHLLGSRSLGEFAHRNHVGPALDPLLYRQPKLLYIHVQVLKDGSADPAAFFDQAQQDMFCSYVFMVKTLGLLVCQRHNLTCSICKTLKHFLPQKLSPQTHKSKPLTKRLVISNSKTTTRSTNLHYTTPTTTVKPSHQLNPTFGLHSF